MKAYINKIIPSTFIDGPGSRMAIFFQGCNMHCLYCHNPETQQYCHLCGDCLTVCPNNALTITNTNIKHNHALCQGCDKCLQICQHFSSPKYAQMTVEELYNKVMDVAPFLDGITISGGECTLQAEFIYPFFKKIKESTNLTTFIDTNGYMETNIIRKLTAITDGFMLDLKVWDRHKHFELTGVDNMPILKNMTDISNKGLLYEVRTVLVSGFTDNAEEITNIANFIKNLNDYTKLKLIPFRPFGVKSSMASYPPFPQERYEKLSNIAQSILKERVTTIG